MENYYNTLGIAPNATEDEIKKVYRSLAMRYHPDRNQAPGADARFKAIAKAYEVLSDPVKREEYNQSLNHRIIIDAEAEAYQLWRSVFNLQGVTLPAADTCSPYRIRQTVRVCRAAHRLAAHGCHVLVVSSPPAFTRDTTTDEARRATRRRAAGPSTQPSA